MAEAPMARIERWFAAKGWSPAEYQRRAWAAFSEGESGLIHAPTGTGKTYAAWLGPMMRWLEEHEQAQSHGKASAAADSHAPPAQSARTKKKPHAKQATAEPIRIVWVTPLRALAGDTVGNLLEPIEALGLPWSVEKRTGDTSQSVKTRQRKRLPSTLVTTPESLSLLLSYTQTREQFRSLWSVVVDEWHELISSKRGVQTELCLARLRTLAPGLQTWGLSATLGNLDQAMHTLLGERETGVLIEGRWHKRISVTTLLPGQSQQANRSQQGQAGEGQTHSSRSNRVDRGSDSAGGRGGGKGRSLACPGSEKCVKPAVETNPLNAPQSSPGGRFPWAGHLGTVMVEPVIEAVSQATTSLVFTNTRSQCELWFAALLRAEPPWVDQIAMHHGSIDRQLREEVEAKLAAGQLRCVVCTSSLDLGVDFSPVDRVIQVGSPKGIARLMQRAGRSGHQPGVISEVLGVPTHAFELIEFAAAREGIEARAVESRQPITLALDVLSQHLVTLAIGGGFDARATCGEVRSTHAFAKLSDAQWQWVMDFVTRGGPTLRAYPRYQKVKAIDDVNGLGEPAKSFESKQLTSDDFDARSHASDRYRTTDRTIAAMHRMAIGTITSESSMRIAYQKGQALGHTEESFISRLRIGDRFMFAGKALELLRVRGMTATVKRSTKKGSAVPRWMGGRSPLSTQLAQRVRGKLDEARLGQYDGPEMLAVKPMLELQRAWSIIPAPGELLIETNQVREDHHAFVFGFAGRLVHEGLATLLAYRISQTRPISITGTANDYGVELLAAEPLTLSEDQWREVLRLENLTQDLLAALDASQLARRRFRSIAQIAGLVFPGYPGQSKATRQLQASSELFYDVFRDFDPDHALLAQAHREVLDNELEVNRMNQALQRLETQRIRLVQPPRLTPLAFPLWAARIRESHITSERWSDRISRMAADLEQHADAELG